MLYNAQIKFEHEKLLHLFVCTVKGQFWTLTDHAKKRILERIGDIEKIGCFIRNYTLKYDDIIEYTFINGWIEKVLIRTQFDHEKDIILSISHTSKIITVYINDTADKHFTLNKHQYQTA